MGTSGNDILVGTSSNDVLTGNAGNDILWGRGGDDTVNGGNDNDILIYDVELNEGMTDSYNGGAGADTLVLSVSSETWFDVEFQTELKGMVAAALDNGNSFDFSGFDLSVVGIESVLVEVDGDLLDARDEAVDAMDDEFFIFENDSDGETGDPFANDSVPDLVRDVNLIQGPSYGWVVANEDGTYTYVVKNNDPAVDALNDGEVLVDEIIYEIVDADGDRDTATISVTINGVSDSAEAGADLALADDFMF